MTIALQFTNVTVNDVDESIAFYRDALGLEVQNDVKSGDHRWVTLGTSAQPGLGIVLSDPHAGRSQADGDALQELLTKGVLPMLVFNTDDLDATFETVRATLRTVSRSGHSQAESMCACPTAEIRCADAYAGLASRGANCSRAAAAVPGMSS